MADVEKKSVTLKVKGHDITQEFGEEQALRLLKMPKAAWELADKEYKFNGQELSKK